MSAFAMSTFAGCRWIVALACGLSLALAVVPAVRAEGDAWAAAPSASFGTVRSIERSSGADRPHGAGAVVGGILGAVIGRQFAEGSAGRNVGAAIGAAAGALIGNEIEKSVRREQALVRITVTLDDGSVRSFEFREAGDLRVGDRVRIDGNMLYRVS